MPYAYVYAPITGQNWGQEAYCTKAGQPPHAHVWPGELDHPQDIEGDPQDWVRFYASSVVKRIDTQRIDFMCGSRMTPITWGILVTMYLNVEGTRYLGKVLYGHLDNRINNGSYTTGLWGRQLGQLPQDIGADTGCYSGEHTHLECKNGHGSF